MSGRRKYPDFHNNQLNLRKVVFKVMLEKKKKFTYTQMHPQKGRSNHTEAVMNVVGTSNNQKSNQIMLQSLNLEVKKPM